MVGRNKLSSLRSDGVITISGIGDHDPGSADHDHRNTQLLTVPGIAYIVATALVAFVGDIHRFPSARHFASYLGLTPKEFSSGSKRRLGRISKKGDVYLRMLLIHGARSILAHAHKAKQPDRLQSWALQLERKVGSNKAAVALANKIARIAWAVWKHDCDFESRPVAA